MVRIVALRALERLPKFDMRPGRFGHFDTSSKGWLDENIFQNGRVVTLSQRDVIASALEHQPDHGGWTRASLRKAIFEL